IRPAAGGEVAALHLGDEIAQPIGVGDTVAVGVGNNFSGRRLRADIAGCAQPVVRLADDPAEAVALGDGESAVARAVIDDDDLIIRVVEHGEGGEALLDRALGVVGANHNGNSRVAWQLGWQGALILASYLAE